MRMDILLGALTIAMAFLGSLTSIFPPVRKRWKIVYLLLFAFLGIFSVYLVSRQSNEAARVQAGLQNKLGQSLLTEENMKGQLQSIALVVGKIGEGKTDSDMKRLASAIAEIADSAGQGKPHVISVVAPNAGLFQVPNKLGCTPSYATIDMTSGGLIFWQSPKKMFDSKNLYLTASDSGETANILVWCKP